MAMAKAHDDDQSLGHGNLVLGLEGMGFGASKFWNVVLPAGFGTRQLPWTRGSTGPWAHGSIDP